MSGETGPETVECVNCGASIRKHADVCHQCGVENQAKPGKETRIDPERNGGLEGAFRYPVRAPDAVERLFIGGLLSYGFFLILPVFVVLGYLLQVLDNSARGVAKPPEFSDLGEMIVDGLKFTFVTLVYGIVPLILVVISFVIIGSGQGTGSAGGILGGIGVLGLFLSLVAAVVLSYIVPAALTNLAVVGSMEAAFDIDTIKEVALSGDYLVAWLIPFVLAILVNVVVGLLWLTLIGLVLVPFIQFYVQIVVFHLFGAAFGEVIDLDGSEETTESDVPSI